MPKWDAAKEARYQQIKAQVQKLQDQQMQAHANKVAEEDKPLEDVWYNPIELAAGGLASPVRGATAAAGRGTSKLAQWFGGKMAGMGSSGAAAYAKNPAAAEALLKMSPLARQGVAKEALQGVSNELSGRAAGLEDMLQKTLAGKTVPSSEVSGLEEFLQPVGESVPASDVYAAARKAGEAAKFRPSAMDPTAYQSKIDAAKQAFGKLRGAVGKAVPEAEPTIADLGQGIEAQKAVTRAIKSPIASFTTAAPDKQAALQKAQELVGSSALSDLANQFTAANALDKPAEGVIQNLVTKPVGQAIVKGGSVLGRALEGSTAAKIGEAGIGAAAVAPASRGLEEALGVMKSGQQQEQWTPEHEAEYQRIKQQVMQLQGGSNGGQEGR